jgi:hypothetical protein
MTCSDFPAKDSGDPDVIRGREEGSTHARSRHAGSGTNLGERGLQAVLAGDESAAIVA